ncbi:MAG TPA: DUF1778 domain-containing protein [Thermomicrobiaceae bacterium]|nr:DUF1778 domain-containing protein [Thermomicrobiaceae bacterium]
MGTAKTRSPRREQARLEARIPVEQKELIQHAATLAGLSLTDFVLRSAQEAAEQTIRRHQVMTLNAEDSTAFAEAILNPPEPNDALRAALRGARAFRHD